MTLGQALHMLPGMDHFSGSQGHCCCCCHSADDSKPDDSKPAPDRASFGSTGQPAEDCPICDLLALCQNRPADPPALVYNERVEQSVCASPSLPHSEPPRLPSARGPPNA
jgi:hypothetical protein